MRPTPSILVPILVALAAPAPVGAAVAGTTLGARSGPYAFAVAGRARAFLGIETLDLTPELRVHFGVPADEGVLVARLVPGGPAEAAGIRVGDILLSIDGRPVDGVRSILRVLDEKKGGDALPVRLWRDGAAVDVVVRLEETEPAVIELAGPRVRWRWRGGAVELDEEEIERTVEQALEGVREYFESEEWKEKMERLRRIDWERIEEKMKKVEERLRELERRLGEERNERRRRP